MAEYRWNQAELAEGWDAAAQYVHPHYLELQQVLLGLLPFSEGDDFLLVDAGGGPGRLAELFLRQFKNARAVVVDQSQPFLDIAARRMARFGNRGTCQLARLQDEWLDTLAERPSAIVSMSAIHHLDPQEKQTLYARCFDALVPGGVLMNGDEVRPESDADYLAALKTWAAHKRHVVEAGLIPPSMADSQKKWEERNVGGFCEPRVSGDDCHETIAAQLGYFRAAGFSRADCPWQREMWAVLRGFNN